MTATFHCSIFKKKTLKETIIEINVLVIPNSNRVEMLGKYKIIKGNAVKISQESKRFHFLEIRSQNILSSVESINPMNTPCYTQ